jgi:hypothetical protein
MIAFLKIAKIDISSNKTLYVYGNTRLYFTFRCKIQFYTNSINIPSVYPQYFVITKWIKAHTKFFLSHSERAAGVDL